MNNYNRPHTNSKGRYNGSRSTSTDSTCSNRSCTNSSDMPAAKISGSDTDTPCTDISQTASSSADSLSTDASITGTSSSNSSYREPARTKPLTTRASLASSSPTTSSSTTSEMEPSASYGLSEARFWIQRLSKTAVRALHILGVAGSAGGILYGLEKAVWIHWWIMAMVTGILLITFELMQSRLWLIQLKGVLTLVKLGLLSCFFILPEEKAALYVVVILMSVIVAHGPAGLRHYSIWHRRRIDEPKGRKKSMHG